VRGGVSVGLATHGAVEFGAAGSGGIGPSEEEDFVIYVLAAGRDVLSFGGVHFRGKLVLEVGGHFFEALEFHFGFSLLVVVDKNTIY